MAIEIERKFLVKNDDWRRLATGTVYRQGYILSGVNCTVRARLAGDRGYLTIKGATSGISRSEFEYEIPGADASELLNTLCAQSLIEKMRYKIPFGDLIWEVDEFVGANQGLIVAEVELPSPDYPIALPDWIGQEVSGDQRYLNSSLAKLPFSKW
jgi:adenylate cyclase